MKRSVNSASTATSSTARRTSRHPHLVALFSESIGAYGAYLEDQGIAAMWQTGDGWEGTSTAAAWGLVD
ncbi:hypothetical protein ACFSNO_30965 [Streptomyces cirratus]